MRLRIIDSRLYRYLHLTATFPPVDSGNCHKKGTKSKTGFDFISISLCFLCLFVAVPFRQECDAPVDHFRMTLPKNHGKLHFEKEHTT